MNDAGLLNKALRTAFPGITSEEVIKIINRGKVAHYPPGTTLCLEGNIEDVFYIIITGDVKVTKEISSESHRVLKLLKPGDFFGEMGLIHDAPRAATVTTLTNTSVLEIDKNKFKESLQQISTVSLAMVREVSRRLRENDEMAIEDLRLKAGELADAYQQLAELDLARREFLTTIAHELRTPLTSIGGYIQMIRAGKPGEDLLWEMLDTVSRNIGRIIDLTNDILFLQEMELILSDFEPLNLGNIIHSILVAEGDFAEQMGVKIALELPTNESIVYGDEVSLSRALKAIINNAIKFTINGGWVTIKVLLSDEDLKIQIADNGIGIPKKNIPFIFDRFWRTEEYQGHLFSGVGIGLSIAKQVVEQHGGKILVASQVGKGTTFTIILQKSKDVIYK